jgi:uncharacterized protein YndB with AHSA1/START domain
MTKRRTITLERNFDASIDDVWELWTTKEGIESWWGPEGFAVTVVSLDLRPAGELHYVMAAATDEMAAFMKKSGMPASQKLKITYTEIVPGKRLAYMNWADFIPGVAPYEAATSVDLYPSANGVRMVLTLDAMHDEVWTQRAVMGWESELGKLAKALARR